MTCFVVNTLDKTFSFTVADKERNQGLGKKIYNSVPQILKKLNIPVVYDADISHKDPCMTIVNGSIIDVDVKDGKAKVNMKLK